MSDLRWVGLAAMALCGAALAAWRRTRRQLTRLQRRLESSAMELQRLQMAFARFAPAQVVDRIAASGVATDAEKRDVTILFADLVGFTVLGEQLDPAVLVTVLNGHFERMSRVVEQHRGHVSKFIGDNLLALFGALDLNPWQANDAVHAALAMHAELEDYNRELAARGLPQLRVGIGIHRGVAVAGIIGSRELVEFTVIGGAVNLAARVERLTRVHDAGILVTRAVRDGLDPRFVLREMPAVPVRGIADRVVTFAVDGFRE